MKFTAGLGKLGCQACAKASRGLSAPRRQEHPPGQPRAGVRAGAMLVSWLKAWFFCSVIQCRRHKGTK